MIHNFKYSFRILFQNKALVFWAFAFPILLGTFFYMAFQNIEKNEVLTTMDIAVVETEQYQKKPLWSTSFQALSEKETPLFKIRYVKDEKQAQELLEKNTIIGYLLLEENPKIVVQKNGVYQTVLKTVVEEIQNQEDMLKQMIAYKIKEEGNWNIHDENWYHMIISDMQKRLEREPIIQNISSSNLSYTMIEFYTLIAMTALYGGILGMYAINQVLANMSANGKRVAISPISKGKLIMSSAFASYVAQLIGMVLLFLYTIFVLKVDYGNQLFAIVLLSMIGCFAGLSLGIMIASVFKTNENNKIGIVIAVTMLGCFLSGMMGITMKYVIDKNIPIINRVNPASMITDGFYALYYYGVGNRMYFNIVSLLLFSFVMIMLAILSLRRQKYDSI